MYYEINISLNGSHFFATSDRSLCHEDRAAAVLKVIKAKFPEAEGYSIMVSLCNVTGRNVTAQLEEKLKAQTPKRPHP